MFTSPQTREAEPAVDYAGFWARAGALVIDWLVVTGFAAAVLVTFGFWMGLTGIGDEDTVVAIGFLASLLFAWLYFAISESSAKQAILGKRAVGIAVTDLAGRRISFGRATARSFARWLNNVLLGIGYVKAAFTSQKRGLHDYVAGTLVVRRRIPDSKTAGTPRFVAR
jgi:uncharacterized RDD family membrane protein YckC